MSEDDNSVNMENDKARYHHGDLRAALISEGLALLDAGNAETLSLREIARNVGVSATAVYRHFPDKKALLSALARHGGELLFERQVTAQQAAGGGVAGFDATGRAYVSFALDHPALFRLMTENARLGSALESARHERDGLALLRQNIASLAAPGTTAEAQRVSAIRSWAIVHGLALLMLDGQVPRDQDLIGEVVKSETGPLGFEPGSHASPAVA